MTLLLILMFFLGMLFGFTAAAILCAAGKQEPEG